jgi:hypothetical protein
VFLGWVVADLVLSIDSEIPKALAWLGTMRGQVPFAISQALNKTGFDIRKGLADGTKQYFDNPTSFTEKAFYVQRGNKQDPTVLVGPQRNRPYFIPQIRGGQRFPKGFEGWARGLSGGRIKGKLVPTGLAVDGRGNPKKALFGQIERGLSTTGAGGFFIGTPKGAGRPAGIYRRSQGKLFAYFIETSREPQYKPRFPMEQIGQSVFNRVAGDYLRSSLQSALATAR